MNLQLSVQSLALNCVDNYCPSKISFARIRRKKGRKLIFTGERHVSIACAISNPGIFISQYPACIYF